jgi:glycosyltransferase involved in cell wall biosynthesis
MRIGVDARELCGRATGVGRYLAGLLREWGVGDRARHEFVLYAPGDISISLDTRRFATRAVPGSGGTVWEQIRLPSVAAKDHLDVWFAPAYSAPLRLRLPTVVAIHDLSFVAHPEWFTVREGARRRFLASQSAQRARAVITISDFSRQELVERLGVPAEKIRVIPPGVTTDDSRLMADDSRLMTGDRPLATRPNVLFVGSIFNRRHVPDLVRAFAPIARSRPDATLDLVGDNRSRPYEDLVRTIATEGLERQVRWHTYVTEDRLHALYAQAGAFAFLSEYEGLGLTPLEALAAGVPPVLLDTAVARESCGDAALYVPPNDRGAITRALEQALFSGTTRARVLAAAPGVLARYNWRRAATDTLAVLEAAADRRTTR